MYVYITGLDQMQTWRHSYAVRPPKLNSFSPYYPGNDERYVKYVKDMPISVFESVIRSVANGRVEVHRKFPKTESLKDSKYDMYFSIVKYSIVHITSVCFHAYQ